MGTDHSIFMGIPAAVTGKYPPAQLPALTLAYVGDAVYDLYVRCYLLSQETLRVNLMHREAIRYVRAAAQADALDGLSGLLTETEQGVVRRGRNAKSPHCPKNADPADYQKATAFEALVGFLFLIRDEGRLAFILDQAIKIIEGGMVGRGEGQIKR